MQMGVGTMTDNCTHDCNSCKESCPSKNPDSLIESLNDKSSVKKVIGVASGKGGVGKSMVTELLAVLSARMGYRTAILDADITGPSIPKAFGITGQLLGENGLILPKVTHSGIKLISANLMLEEEQTPVIWRGPVIAGAVKQFWTDVLWGELDLMFIDMPPGTGDVPLTVFQSIPLDGLIIVTTPQDLVTMVVGKAVNMAKKMDIPILGMIENMSYVECPDCGKKIELYGASRAKEVADAHEIRLLAQVPIVPQYASLCDRGEIEKIEISYLGKAMEAIGKLLDA